jgi:hypothetical protein
MCFFYGFVESRRPARKNGCWREDLWVSCTNDVFCPERVLRKQVENPIRDIRLRIKSSLFERAIPSGYKA